jgi:hypothetical protein
MGVDMKIKLETNPSVEELEKVMNIIFTDVKVEKLNTEFGENKLYHINFVYKDKITKEIDDRMFRIHTNTIDEEELKKQEGISYLNTKYLWISLSSQGYYREIGKSLLKYFGGYVCYEDSGEKWEYIKKSKYTPEEKLEINIKLKNLKTIKTIKNNDLNNNDESSINFGY